MTKESIASEREAAIAQVGVEFVVVTMPTLTGVTKVRAQVNRLRPGGKVELRLCGSGFYSGGYTTIAVSEVATRS